MAYLIPILYLIVSYSFFLLTKFFDNELTLKIISLLLPFLMGIINFIVVLTVGRRWPKRVLLNCSLIIKYGLIPFYLAGGILVARLVLMAVFPLPFMIFFGFVAILFLIFGYGILLGAAPYSIAYIIKACKEGTHSKWIAILTGICQFFFSFDVLSMMFLALKEKHLVKTTILVFSMTCLSILVFLLFLVISFLQA